MAIIQIKRGTAAEWNAANPILALAELGLETDTNKMKAGDGVTAWSGLSYMTGDGGGGAVESVNGRVGQVVLTKADVGLDAVDNTSDLDKPVSTATQAALSAKSDYTDVTILDGRVSTNETNISTNTGNIATNTGNIATNTADIATNTGNIGAKISSLSEDPAPTLGGNLNLKSYTITSDTVAQLTTNLSIEPTQDAVQDIGEAAKRWKDIYIQDGVNFSDKRTGAASILSIRDGQLTVTDSTNEVTTAVDLGGTTPDPGHIRNVEIDGTGRYAVGPSTLANTNGFITREFINTPGQFFVINDIDGGVFTGGNRQCFGLVRETIVDGTDLSGRTEGLFTGGNSGGWSTAPFWYYTGGYPYIWTNYSIPAQTPQGSGEGYNGTFGNQNAQRAWWGACTTVGVGKKYRVGIADGTNSDATGANFSNRLIHQLYVPQEVIDDADVLATLPANVATYGAGWYTAWATSGDYENMGQFPDDNTGYAASRQAGADKGYRFRWSTFGNTTLNQLPYVQGVPSINDQIAAATGLSYYLVYEPTAADKAAANVTIASGTTSAENPFYQSKEVVLLQFQQPYDSFETAGANVFDISPTAIGAVKASPLFTTYDISDEDAIIESGLSVQGIEAIRSEVSKIVLQSVIGYYMIRGLGTSDRQTVRTAFAEIINAANTGQLQEVFDLTAALSPDPLYPQELLDAILQSTGKYLMNYPVF